MKVKYFNGKGKYLFSIDTENENYRNALKGTGFEHIYDIDKVQCTKKCIDDLIETDYCEHVLNEIPYHMINKEIANYVFDKNIENYPFIPTELKTEDMTNIAMKNGRNKFFNLISTPGNLIKPEYFDIDFDNGDVEEALAYSNLNACDFQSYIREYNAKDFYEKLCLIYNEELLYNPIREFINDDFKNKIMEINMEDILSLLPKEFITQDIVNKFIDFVSTNEVHPRRFNKMRIDKSLIDYNKLNDLIDKNPYAICILDKSMLTDDLIIKAINADIPGYIIDSIDLDLSFGKSINYLKNYMINKDYDNKEFIPIPSIFINDLEFLVAFYNKNYKNIHIDIGPNSRFILNYLNEDVVNYMINEVKIDLTSLLESKYYNMINRDYIVKYCNRYKFRVDYNELVRVIGLQSKDDFMFIINNIKDAHMVNWIINKVNNYKSYYSIYCDKNIDEILNNIVIKNKFYNYENINKVLEKDSNLIYDIIEHRNCTIKEIDRKFLNEDMILKIKEKAFSEKCDVFYEVGDCIRVLKYYPEYFTYDDLLYFLKNTKSKFITLEDINPAYITKEVLDIIFSSKFINSYYDNLSILGKL